MQTGSGRSEIYVQCCVRRSDGRGVSHILESEGVNGYQLDFGK